MGKYSRLGKNTVFVFMGNAGAKLIGLVMLPFYTRWLSVADYGLTDIISVYVTLLIGIVSCCIGESLFIFPKNADEKGRREYFTTGIVFLFTMIILTALLFGLIGIIRDVKDIHGSFFDNLWLIYGLMVCMLLQQTIQQFTRSIDKMIVYSATGLLVTVATVGFSFAIIPHYGAYGYVMSLDLAYLTSAAYSLCASGAYRYFSIRCCSKQKCIEMLKYSTPLIPNGVMWWLVGALNRPIMETNVGLEGIGLFAVANKFPGILTMLFGVFATSWQISVLEEYGKEDFTNFYNRILRAVTFLLCLLLVGITMISRWLVELFTTPDYYSAWLYIPILTLGALLSSMSSMAGTVYSATRQSKYFFYSSVWGAAVAVVFNTLLIPLLGVLGAAISVVLSFLAMSVSRMYYANKIVEIKDIGIYSLMLLLLVLLSITCFLHETYLMIIFSIMVLLIIIVMNYFLIKDFKYLLIEKLTFRR